MLFSSFSFSEVALSDIKLQRREFWFSVTPAPAENWSSIAIATVDSNSVLTSSDIASSFSEVAFSQSGLSDLGINVKREAWSRKIRVNSGETSTTSTTNETWSSLSPTGAESWSNITPSSNESWVDKNLSVI